MQRTKRTIKYDAHGRVNKESTLWPDGSLKIATTSYDDNGRIAEIITEEYAPGDTQPAI